ncbi:DUF6602 domain-containing protein [Nocardioides lijunqiniae]|uniref:DUF6602 domain-containing protein n=1 Tax=Nocardioides lijunqiniae TaxID=2760832 RepID=UPI0018775CBF|nr:DUF6602 domain-containing protein [Nocardioides lijunqiniae]
MATIEEGKIAHQASETGLVAAYDAAVSSLLSIADVFRKLFPNAAGNQSGHAGEEGRWTESLLAEFLRRNLPASLEVSTGFILDSERGLRSYQIDILIHDPSVSAPVLRYGEAVVVTPESVLGAISVKHTLRQNTLEKELSELSNIGDLCGRGGSAGPYLGLVAYEVGRARRQDGGVQPFEAFAKSIGDTYMRVFTTRSERAGGLSAGEIVESVVALDGFLLHASTLSSPRAGLDGAERKKVKVVWAGPTGNWRYVLGVELIEGITRRYHRRQGFTAARGWPARTGLAMSPLGAIPIVCESRPPSPKETTGVAAPPVGPT